MKFRNLSASFGADSVFLVPVALWVTASRAYPFEGSHRLKDKAKYIGRGLLMPRLMHRWFQFLRQPEMLPLVAACPRLYSKLQRPYLHLKLGAKDRLSALSEHYRFVLDRLAPAALVRIYSRPGVTLAEFAIPEMGDFSVRLLYWNKFEKEGELTLALFEERHGERGISFALSFTLRAAAPDRSEFFIGGLQGFKRLNERQYVVDITRGMHGLRPKGLLLFALQQIADVWQVRDIRAAGDEMRVFNYFWLRHKPVMSSCSEFWRESDGISDADGNFTLPARFVPRPLADIKPNKRSLYRKRYSLLETLTAQIQSRLRGLEKGPARLNGGPPPPI